MLELPRKMEKSGRGNAGKGRKKGVPNKDTKALREMILEALENQSGGGVAYLCRKAEEEPRAFLALLGRVLPTQVTGLGDGPLEMRITWAKPPSD